MILFLFSIFVYKKGGHCTLLFVRVYSIPFLIFLSFLSFKLLFLPPAPGKNRSDPEAPDLPLRLPDRTNIRHSRQEPIRLLHIYRPYRDVPDTDPVLRSPAELV